jgi:hypothetical protein
MIFGLWSSRTGPDNALRLVETRGHVAAGIAPMRAPARIMNMQSEPPFIAAFDVASTSSYRQQSSATVRTPHHSGHRDLPVNSPALSSTRGTDYVTIPVAAAMTGYSAKAIRRKIEAGVWLEGREFRRAPDGHVLISVKGYELWVERGRA